MTRTVVVPVFGVEAEAQIPEIEILTFKCELENRHRDRRLC